MGTLREYFRSGFILLTDLEIEEKLKDRFNKLQAPYENSQSCSLHGTTDFPCSIFLS